MAKNRRPVLPKLAELLDPFMGKKGTTYRSCVHCGARIYREPNAGWVDAVSGDDGGTYDYCPDNPDGHDPVK